MTRPGDRRNRLMCPFGRALHLQLKEFAPAITDGRSGFARPACFNMFVISPTRRPALKIGRFGWRSAMAEAPHSNEIEALKLELEKRRLELDDALRRDQLREEAEKRQFEERRHADQLHAEAESRRLDEKHHAEEIELKREELRIGTGKGFRLLRLRPP